MTPTRTNTTTALFSTATRSWYEASGELRPRFGVHPRQLRAERSDRHAGAQSRLRRSHPAHHQRTERVEPRVSSMAPLQERERVGHLYRDEPAPAGRFDANEGRHRIYTAC